VIPVLLPTCNSHAWLVPKFAALWNKYCGWPVTVVHYDTAPPELPANFTPLPLGEQSAVSWTAGVAEAVEQLGAPRFLLMLEDFFLRAPADSDNLLRVDAMMQSDAQIGLVDVSSTTLAYKPPAETTPSIDDLLYEYGLKTGWSTTTQAGIWSAAFFLDCADSNDRADDIWTFERSANYRLFDGGYDWRVLAVRRPLLTYNACFSAGTFMPAELSNYSAEDRALLGV